MNWNKWLRPNIINLKPYASARSEFKGKAQVWLDANESPFENGLNRYPDPLQMALKKEIGRLNEVEPNQIFLGNGSDEVLDLLIRASCEPGKDAILINSPTYGMYQVLAAVNNVECREVFLNEEFSLNIESIQNAISENVKIIFICSPNNPTGNLMDKTVIEQLLKSFNGLVVVDEAYIHFCEESTLINSLNGFSNLFVVQTFSKFYGAAAARLGIGFGASELIEVLNRVKPPYNINLLTQNAALKLLKNQAENSSQKQVFNQLKSSLKCELEQLDSVLKVFPSDANFFLVKVKNATEIYNYLLSKGVVVRNRSSQHNCENTLRISVGLQTENELLINSLKMYEKNKTLKK